MTATVRQPLGLKLYRGLSRAAEPVASLALKRRLRAGKEDPDRVGERQGLAGRERPEGELLWVHGASVGESLSVIPLVRRLQDARPGCSFLVTTGTVTSARLMAERLPERAFHQYVPLDHPDFVARFLDHWRPDGAIFVESEFWPNLILAARERLRWMALVNGRISPRSFEDWKRQPNAIKYILSSFDVIIAQDRQNAERLAALSAKDVATLGNLKNAAPPLPADADEFIALRDAVGARPVWLAASTHPGEEETVIAAHDLLRADFPDLLTIIAPRHPQRGGDVAALAQGRALARRSAGETITPHTAVYIADTLGELGLFYRLGEIAFVGGALTPKGGHNPLEPARLGSAILHGPHIFNFTETYADIRAVGGAALVRNERELTTAVKRLLADDVTRRSIADAAKAAAEKSAERVLVDICDALNATMPLPAPTGPSV